jgi:hypothetical protein
MYTIYKYTLSTTGMTDIYVPAGSKVLSVQDQYGQLTIWFLVPSTTGQSVTRRFHSYMTGDYIHQEPGEHVGSVLFDGGAFVVHVFERHST